MASPGSHAGERRASDRRRDHVCRADRGRRRHIPAVRFLRRAYLLTNSTLLFCARPASVLLSPTGFVSPNPVAVKRSAGTLKVDTRYCLTAAARASDNVLFEAAVPTLSVWP